MRNEYRAKALAQALVSKFGNTPFTSADAVRELADEDLPPVVRRLLVRNGNSSAAQSLGLVLRTHPDVQVVSKPGSRLRLWQVTDTSAIVGL